MNKRRIWQKFKQLNANTTALIGLILISGVAFFPILWSILTSIKINSQIFSYPPQWIPHSLNWGNYLTVLWESNLPLYFRNSLIITFFSLIISLVLSVHAAYALSRYHFRGNSLLLIGILATSMIPGVAILVPLYSLSVKIRLYDSFMALIIVYAAWNIPILVWLLKGFFDKVPLELEEAAMCDGCSRTRAFYKIVLPMAQPGLISGAMMVIMMVWNDFLIGFTLTISEERRPLSVGLYSFMSSYGIEWGQLMAGVVISFVPIVIGFLLVQKRLVEGLTAGAVKG